MLLLQVQGRIDGKGEEKKPLRPKITSTDAELGNKYSQNF